MPRRHCHLTVVIPSPPFLSLSLSCGCNFTQSIIARPSAEKKMAGTRSGREDIIYPPSLHFSDPRLDILRRTLYGLLLAR